MNGLVSQEFLFYQMMMILFKPFRNLTDLVSTCNLETCKNFNVILSFMCASEGRSKKDNEQSSENFKIKVLNELELKSRAVKDVMHEGRIML